MGMQAGKLRHPIALERLAAGSDDYGGETGSWAELARTRAMFMPGTGQERRDAAQEQASVAATFRVRRSAVTRSLVAKDRIRFDPSAPLPAGVLPSSLPSWDITSVAPYERYGIDITAVRSV